ncbi:hypothetical protein AMJ80_07675, partial [bacterium SM23_31]
MNVTLRKRKLSRNRYSLYLDIYYHGKRYYEFLKLYLGKDNVSNKETLRLAENIRAKRQLEIQNNEYGFIPSFKRNLNFVDYFKKIADNKKHLRYYKATLNLLEQKVNGHVKISNIDEKFLTDFQSYLLENTSSPNTAHSYFSTIVAVLNNAVRDKIIFTNPANNIPRPKKQDVERTFLTLSEIQALSVTPCKNSQIKRAFLFACYTGLRLSDAKKLQWENIKGNRIEFRQKKTN